MTTQIDDIQAIIRCAEEALSVRFAEIDETALCNQKKVLEAFRQNRLTEEYFAERTGYGLNDPAREALDSIYATVFRAQSAAVRMQFVSGTHAIACALGGNLKCGDKLVSLTGEPYDTLRAVIGLGEAKTVAGSLCASGIEYVEIDLSNVLHESDEQIQARLMPHIAQPNTMAYIQKSCGYSFDRPTLTNSNIERLIRIVKQLNNQCIVMVDNCYGEFVEAIEPTDAGADLTAGSLIKNPGGGLAISGGYVAGRKDFVEACLNRLTAPGIGGHLGLTFNQARPLLQGLFLAPSVVSQALKGALLSSFVFSQLGLNVKPGPFENRGDIIQAIRFGERKLLINFCRAVQKFSPVNAHVEPEPHLMPGYEDEVIMAGGTFVEGSTIELSADGPLRAPYAAFLQGGLTYLHTKCMLEGALSLSRSGETPFLPDRRQTEAAGGSQFH